MSMTTKNGLIILLLFLLLPASFLFRSIRIHLRSKEPQDLVFVHSFESKEKEAVERKLRLFQQLHPEIKLNALYMDRQSLLAALKEETFQVDLLVWNGPIKDSLPFNNSTPMRWTGDSWNLAVNPEEIPQDALESLQNDPDLEDFQWILQRIQEEGKVPLSLGNSHLWPLTVWSQHIILSLNSQGGTSTLPDLSKDDPYRLQSWKILKDWKAHGFFLESTLDEGWARGISAFSQGNAAMVLMSGSMITAIEPEKRAAMLFLPFPQNHDEDSWVIGTGLSLIQNLDSLALEEAQILQDFLCSPGITQSLTDELNQLFYASEDSSAERYIPSWSTLANSPEMRRYGKELEDYVIHAP